jgi:hypothetical protein
MNQRLAGRKHDADQATERGLLDVVRQHSDMVRIANCGQR